MLIIKMIIYILIFLTTFLIGTLKSRKYKYRVEELKDFKTALNIFKIKLKFTYEPLPEIFLEISEKLHTNMGKTFKIARIFMKEKSASLAWEEALDRDVLLNITKEDKSIIKNLGNLLGETDIEGQINQIDLTDSFINKQISDAEKEKQKNEKLFRVLGATIGFAIIIILM